MLSISFNKTEKNRHFFQDHKTKYTTPNINMCLIPKFITMSFLPWNWNNILLSYTIFCNTTKASSSKHRGQNRECVSLIKVSVMHFLSSSFHMPISYGLDNREASECPWDEVTYPPITFLLHGWQKWISWLISQFIQTQNKTSLWKYKWCSHHEYLDMGNVLLQKRCKNTW